MLEIDYDGNNAVKPRRCSYPLSVSTLSSFVISDEALQRTCINVFHALWLKSPEAENAGNITRFTDFKEALSSMYGNSPKALL